MTKDAIWRDANGYQAGCPLLMRTFVVVDSPVIGNIRYNIQGGSRLPTGVLADLQSSSPWAEKVEFLATLVAAQKARPS
jgi:hypothetical protein